MSGIIVETLDGEIRVRGGQEADTIQVVIRDDDKEGSACGEMTLEQAHAFLDAFRQYVERAQTARECAHEDVALGWGTARRRALG